MVAFSRHIVTKLYRRGRLSKSKNKIETQNSTPKSSYTEFNRENTVNLVVVWNLSTGHHELDRHLI